MSNYIVEWDGEGLPPVGTVCEVKRALDWMRCKILFISEKHVVLQAQEECVWHTVACQFRPILTEAERRREASTKAMNIAWRARAGEEDDGVLKSIYEIIYDAIATGKIPGIRLADD